MTQLPPTRWTTPVRRSIVAATAAIALLALVVAVVPAPPADAQGAIVRRIAGQDRIATAVAISETSHPERADVVILARADAYPDALAGAPLASHLGAPLLLTGRDAIAPNVRVAIERMGANRAILLGGTGALSNAVADQAEDLGLAVERISGPERFATAAAVAERVVDGEGVSTAYLALGGAADPSQGWPDAVAVSGLAAAERRPVLLTAGDHLSDATAGVIQQMGFERVVLVGGVASLAEQVAEDVEALGVVVERVAGGSRFETSVEIASRQLAGSAGSPDVWLASGRDFPDALAAGAGAAAAGGVLLLTDGLQVTTDDVTGAWIASSRQQLTGGVVVGGPVAISDGVAAQVQSLLNGERPEPVAGADAALPDLEPGPGDVVLPLGSDFQAVIDSHPAGTTFFIAPGLHRLQSIVARDGDHFSGMRGAVMSGAQALAVGQWQRDGSGRWFVDGQTAQGFVQGTEALVNPRDAFPEELFVDSTRRLDHVGSLADLGPGRWFFDYDDDRVYMHDDPAAFISVELSVTPFAIGGLRARDVTVENLVIEHYATPTQKGALGGAIPYDHPWDWTLRYVTVRYNHGAGITIGPGMLIEHALVHHNGQIGIAGTGHDIEDGFDYVAPITVRNSAIHDNNIHEYYWQYEAGGTKFKNVDGMLFENNWVYDNHGPGAWWDLEAQDVIVRSNLIEGNLSNGIHYEISYGQSEIYWNEVRDNGTGGEAESYNRACIMIANSSDIDIFGNVCYGQAVGIRLNHTDRGDGALGRFETSNVTVRDNHVSFTDWTGMQVSNGEDEIYTSRGNRFSGNTYRVADLDLRWFELRNERRTVGQWQGYGMDTDGVFLEGLGSGPFPAGSDPYSPTHHGALSSP